MATLELNVTVPNAYATEALEDITDELGYSPNDSEGNPIPNYPTRAVFLKQKTIEWLKLHLRNKKHGDAMQSAMDTANTAIAVVTMTAFLLGIGISIGYLLSKDTRVFMELPQENVSEVIIK